MMATLLLGLFVMAGLAPTAAAGVGTHDCDSQTYTDDFDCHKAAANGQGACYTAWEDDDPDDNHDDENATVDRRTCADTSSVRYKTV